MPPKRPSGFSLIETIIALALFIIIASGGILAFISSLNMNRTSQENTQAVSLAQEGIEAVRSLRNQSFANLLPGTYGLGISGGQWTFAGSSDNIGKFSRQVIIAPVSRDAGGTIVPSGGTPDADTMLATVRVKWDFTPGVSRQIDNAFYFTNWRKLTGSSSDGLLLYSDGTVTPKWRNYSGSADNFSSENTAITSANGASYIIKTSPQKKEIIAGYVDSSGLLTILCYDGTVWNQEWTVAVGGNGSTRRFDIAYESTSGKSLVLYSTNSSSTNELQYRSKPASAGCGLGNWSLPVNFDPLRTSGTVLWVKMVSDHRRGQNNIAALWADSTSALSAAIWNGSVWVNEPASVTETSLEFVTTPQDVDDFDLAYESVSGDLMLVWANSAGKRNVNGVRYRLCNGGTPACTWDPVITPPTFSNDATNLSLSANPNTDELIFASIGHVSSRLQAGYWNGSVWTNTTNLDNSCATPDVGTKYISTAWLTSGSTSRSLIVYQDSNAANIGWIIGTGGNFTIQTDFNPTPLFAVPQKWYQLSSDPKNKDRALLFVADAGNRLHAKRIVMTAVPGFTWTNSDLSSALETSLSQNITNPFAYAYWQN